jgi:predicted dehydrogenase
MSIRLGFIGIGGIAGMHLQSARDAGIPVTAMYDISENAMKKRQTEFDIEHICYSARELARHPDVDAVVVCSPQHVHLEGIRAACSAKKPLLCEKPLARTLADAHKAAALVDRAGIVMQVAFVRRFCPEWGKFKELMEQNILGNPVAWWMAGGGHGPRSFFTVAEQGGGPMLDGMVHNYDFCRYVWGDPSRVTGSMATLAPENTALDTGTALIEYPNGVRHAIMNSWGLPEGSSTGGLHVVLGPDGTLHFDDPDNDPPADLDTEKQGYFVSKTRDGVRSVHPYDKGNMYEYQLVDFVAKAEAGDTATKATVHDGVRAQEIALAVIGEHTIG